MVHLTPMLDHGSANVNRFSSDSSPRIALSDWFTLKMQRAAATGDASPTVAVQLLLLLVLCVLAVDTLRRLMRRNSVYQRANSSDVGEMDATDTGALFIGIHSSRRQQKDLQKQRSSNHR